MTDQEQKELKGFNPGQLQAVTSPLKQNILISAGAGSGKTKTLSYKVYHLVAYEGIEPSSLLVLTFTNKAAFEMKERIIKQFKDHQGTDSKQSAEIVSAHIQTFDSFSAYLAKKYASILQIPDNLTVADDNVLSAKKSEILDEVLHEYYVNEPERIYNTFSKFCPADDRFMKSLVFSVDKELQKLLPSKRKAFIENYDASFLSRDFFDQCIDGIVENYKKQIRLAFSEAVFNIRTDSFDDVDLLISAFGNPTYYQFGRNTDVELFASDTTKKVYQHFLDVLDTPNKQFFKKLDDLFNLEETKLLFDGSKQWRAIEKDAGKKSPEYCHFYSPLKELIKDNVYQKFVGTYGLDLDQMYEKIISFKDDIHLVFEIVEKMNQRLDQYKLQTNAYTFADIGYLALSLLTEPKYASAAKEIKDRFKYVLVDEYQDTNDIQETFLNALSEKATLFCVGDAKQSIYRFRNSNVQLFMDRKELFERDPSKGSVISMNWNYRSSFELLDAINAIFDLYMTKSHGGISFNETTYDQNKEPIMAQRLDHDPGLKRTMVDGNFYGLGFLSFDSIDYASDTKREIDAIIHDIEDKIKNHYQIIDGNTFKPRDARYSDFAILTRAKGNFSEYQKIFDEAGVPLNIVTEEHLTQINAVLLLQSLIALISCLIQKEKTGEIQDNVRHLFMSVARSYIYGIKEGYDDNHIYEILMDKDSSRLWNDPIMVKAKEFAHSHKESALAVIFLDLLKEFHILDDLVYLGDVVSNNDKIESFYQIVVAQQSIGQGIEDFVKLFKNISKYRIEIAAETDTELENAVSLMTIHKSKGLEFPIVYMPVHFNSLSGSKQQKLACNLSFKRGLVLPYFVYDEHSANVLNASYYMDEGSAFEEINEHVRIFYVALTRAKEGLYIVGNQDRATLGNNSKENLYDMMDYVYHYPKMEDIYQKLMLDEGVITADELDEFNQQLQKYDKICHSTIDIKQFSADELETFNATFADKKDALFSSLMDQVEIFEKKFMTHMLSILSTESIDKKARFLGVLFKKDFTVKNANDFLEVYPNANIESLAKEKMDEIQALISDKKKQTSVHQFVALAYAVYGLKDSFARIVYDEKVIQDFRYDTSRVKDDDTKEEQAYVSPDIEVDDSAIEFKTQIIKKGRASKAFNDDEDLEKVKALDYGTRLHAYLELSDFVIKDTSFIKDINDQKKIDAVLHLPIFDHLEEASLYHEYSYFDPELNSNGSIDLLVVYPDHIDIIDYKTKDIDDPEYIRQLNIYRRNIECLMPGKEIHMILLSILEARTKEVEKVDITD